MREASRRSRCGCSIAIRDRARFLENFPRSGRPHRRWPSNPACDRYALSAASTVSRRCGCSAPRHHRARGLANRSLTRIGLLGGSFNPAHRGHRAISLAAIDALGLDEVWWLVSPGNPLKSGARRHGAAAARLASARADGAPRTDPRRPQSRRGCGTRYTVDTLAKLVRRYPQRPLHLADGRRQSRRSSTSWRDWREIARDGSDCGDRASGL